MIGTFMSYHVLLITQSHSFNSRTRAAASRASRGIGTARSSRWAAANAFALAAFRPPIPTRSTPGLARRSGSVDWAIAPYPPRTSTFKGRPGAREDRTSLILFAPVSIVRDSGGPEDAGASQDQDDTRGERGPVPEGSGHESAEQRSEDRSESLHRIEGAEGPRPSA